MQSEPTPLPRWLQAEMDKRKLNQLNAAASICAGTSTVDDIIRRGHIPKIDTDFRIADYIEAPREKVLRLAANLPPSGVLGNASPEDDSLIHELVEEFRKILTNSGLTCCRRFCRSNCEPPHRIAEESRSEECSAKP
jgi:hypothetical protein